MATAVIPAIPENPGIPSHCRGRFLVLSLEQCRASPSDHGAGEAAEGVAHSRGLGRLLGRLRGPCVGNARLEGWLKETN
eukprot:s4744_g3.t1